MMDEAMQNSCISKEYQTKEFPLAYRNFLVEKYTLQEAFTTECLQKIYQSGQISGNRLLDFGCGPTIHRISSASFQFKEIVLAEYSAENRKELEKWLRGDKDSLDWKPLLEQCARAEGFRDVASGVGEIEKRIRNSVRKVIPCDIHAKNILPEEMGEFDVISSFCCLESCCFNIKTYKEGILKLSKYVKKGGAMIMLSVLQCEWYYVHNNLPAFQVKEEIIKEALTEAGLKLKDWFYWKDTTKHDYIKYDGIVIYYAIKIETC